MSNAPYYMRGQFTNAANAHDVDQYAALYDDHPSSETPIASLEENHNFVELLEAATTAAGQAHQAMNIESAASSGRGKRKRVSKFSVEGHGSSADEVDKDTGAKRSKASAPTDPQLQSVDVERGRSNSGSAPPPNESLLHDARAAGVHSATALFRRSTDKTNRKYTRPPMSKLFTSLQLTPENFLLLQSQAKSYMLDPAHPDRQSCVGNRGKGDTDMVKLRLFKCVKDFLDNGAGQQFFSDIARKWCQNDAIEAARALGEEIASEDRLLWPRDGNKIISLVTPLLRRMVTNERQRMYAIETRKGGAKKKEAVAEAGPPSGNNGGMNVSHSAGQHVERTSTQIPSQPHHLPTLDPVSSPPLSLPLQSPNIIQAVAPKRAMNTYRQLDTKYRGRAHELELAKEPPAEPVLEFVNLFVTKVMPPWSSNRTAEPIPLRVETRFATSNEAPLFHMSWDELCQEVEILLRDAVFLYPELEPKEPLPSEPGLESTREPHSESKQKSLEPMLTGMGPEALRGLAVAATEIQADASAENDDNEAAVQREQTFYVDTTANSSSGTPLPATDNPVAQSTTAATIKAVSPTSQERVTVTGPSVRLSKSPSTADSNVAAPNTDGETLPPQQTTPKSMQPSEVLRARLLPKYEMETLCTKGIKAITCSEDWHMVKLDVACAMWTDKVLTVVVKIL